MFWLFKVGCVWSFSLMNYGEKLAAIPNNKIHVFHVDSNGALKEKAYIEKFLPIITGSH